MIKDFDWVVYEEETNKMCRFTCQKYAKLANKSKPMYIEWSSKTQKGNLNSPFIVVVVLDK